MNEVTDPHYDSSRSDWELARRFHSARPQDVSGYLARAQSESKQAFKERKAHSDCRPYTSSVIRSIVGQLMARSAEAERPEVPNEETAGSKGQSYTRVLSELATTLLLYSEAYLLVDAGVKVLTPLQVQRNQLPTGALVKQSRTPAAALTEKPESQDVWVAYTAEGWTMYDEKGHRVDSGDWSSEGFEYENEDGPTAPLVRVTTELQLGLQLARAHRAVFRKESSLDAAERNSAHSLLQIAARGEEEAKTAVKGLTEGNAYLTYNPDVGEHSFLTPDPKTVASLRETLSFKISQLRSAFESGKEDAERIASSATEAALSQASGAGAIIALLAASMESAEQDLIPLLAQQADMSRGYEPAEVEWPSSWENVRMELPE